MAKDGEHGFRFSSGNGRLQDQQGDMMSDGPDGQVKLYQTRCWRTSGSDDAGNK